MTIRLMTMFALLFALSIAGAQAKQPNLAPFSFLVGTWSCNESETDRGGNLPSKTTWTTSRGGFWLKGATNYGKAAPYADEGESRITYDEDANLWIYEDWRENGGFNLYTTPGFAGDTAVWTNHSFLPTKNVRAISTYTMKKHGDAEYAGTFKETDADGTVVTFQDRCKKS